MSSVHNFDNICRTCLSKDDKLTSIFELRTITMIHTCTSIKINENDDFPKQICVKCLERLKSAYEFNIVCEVTEQHLLKAKLENETQNESNSPETQDHWTSDLDSKIISKIDAQNREVTKQPKLKNSTCGICNKVLVNVSSLRRHMSCHNENRKVRHFCTICKRGFYESSQLTKHIRRHNRDKRYRCEICNKEFYELCTLSLHMRKHKTKPIPCPECDKEFMVKLQLDIHMKSHDAKIRTCQHCSKTFEHVFQLRKHLITHSDHGQFLCPDCHKSFKAPGALRVHIKIFHSGERQRITCTICGKSVKYITEHMLLNHSTVTPFRCNICEKSYASANLLRNHQRCAHQPSREKRFLCSLCGKQAASETDLKIHMRKHTGERPYVCGVCKKAYKTSNSLVIHKRSHTGERPYVCTQCGKRFSTSQILKRHTRVHTGEKPYSCDICQRKFAYNSALKTHLKMHIKC